MFRTFLEGLMTQLLPQKYRKQIVLFVDNSPVHRAKLISEFCEKYEIKMIFNAPYCSDFNPIENLFNLWKTKTHTKVFNSKRDLIIEIVKTSKEISDDENYISSFVLRSLKFWKFFSDSDLTNNLNLELAQQLISEKRNKRIIKRRMRKEGN